MLNTDRISSKLQDQLQAYIDHIGQAQIGIFHFSNISATTEWTGFISVVNTTLSRLGQHPVHLWISSGTERFLILIVNGYFRSSMEDVSEVIKRLWSRRSCSMPILLASWHCNSLLEQEVIQDIFETLGRFSFSYFPAYRYRSFGYSLAV